MNETAEKRTSKWGFLGVSRLFFNDESDEYERHSEDLEDADVVSNSQEEVGASVDHDVSQASSHSSSNNSSSNN